MKLKNIKLIEELEVGKTIFSKGGRPFAILAGCEGAVMIRYPSEDDIVWRVDFDEEEAVDDMYYHEDYARHKQLFKRGLLFQTKEEAIACAKKMLEAIKK
jgi:hypothetical protein